MFIYNSHFSGLVCSLQLWKPIYYCYYIIEIQTPRFSCKLHTMPCPYPKYTISRHNFLKKSIPYRRTSLRDQTIMQRPYNRISCLLYISLVQATQTNNAALFLRASVYDEQLSVHHVSSSLVQLRWCATKNHHSISASPHVVHFISPPQYMYHCHHRHHRHEDGRSSPIFFIRMIQLYPEKRGQMPTSFIHRRVVAD